MIRRLVLAAFAFFLISLHAEDAAKPTPAPTKIVQASAADDIKALVNQTATVEGKVGRIGATTGGGITFINMAKGPNSFVAIVFKSNLAKFPDGLDKYKDQTIRVTGKIVLFKETTPQIEVKTPDQIAIVTAAEATPTPKDGN